MDHGALLASRCPGLELLARGKVRDLYAVDNELLLLVTTDRMSAFDVVMQNGIPDKGRILNQLSVHWFRSLAAAAPHHLVAWDMADMPASVRAHAEQLRGRAVLVKRTRILPIEAIVRGYITGSGWKEYRSSGTVCGIALPAGLQECERLIEPVFTPSTKAEQGSHDENISPAAAAQRIGADLFSAMQTRALALYQEAARVAAARGILIADTKFEFGVDAGGRLLLCDEALTPDSSRFWPADGYAPGRGQPSFDKQYLRDWLESIRFDKKTPIAMPPSVVTETRQRYLDAYQALTGSSPVL